MDEADAQHISAFLWIVALIFLFREEE